MMLKARAPIMTGTRKRASGGEGDAGEEKSDAEKVDVIEHVEEAVLGEGVGVEDGEAKGGKDAGSAPGEREGAEELNGKDPGGLGMELRREDVEAAGPHAEKKGAHAQADPFGLERHDRGTAREDAGPPSGDPSVEQEAEEEHGEEGAEDEQEGGCGDVGEGFGAGADVVDGEPLDVSGGGGSGVGEGEEEQKSDAAPPHETFG